MATEQPKVTLYWLEKSRSQRILMMLEELKVPYELKVFKRDANNLADPALKDIHPLGKSPVLGVKAPGAEKEIVIAESANIVEYLAEHFGKGMIPKRWADGKEGQVGGETDGWLRYRYLMHYCEGSLMSLLVVGLVVSQIANAPAPFFIRPILRGIGSKVRGAFLDRNYEQNWKFIEEQLATTPEGGDFFCGKELTGADIMMLFPLEGATMMLDVKREQYPKMYAWIERMHERESYKAAIKKVEDATGEKYEVIP
ncbi:glutathione S-transferase [Rhizodiscina lignyota]|uniref:Glutathione S-transferase n=1 Tax=Rhizodiscina lignyota TaxID=1504668 RepID=A0A9P4IS17_9PEZI|nr:glutathione S-transferase [Rhizodiscina lignyota]